MMIYQYPINPGENGETNMDETLNQAVSYIKAGEIDKARKLLIQILKDNPKNELAWMWMTHCVTTREQQRECYKRVLEINPENKFAQDGLKKLDTEILLDEFSKAPSQSSQQPQQSVTTSNKSNVPILLAAILIVCVVGVCIMTLVSGGDKQEDKPDKIGASIMCEEFLKDGLKAPSTAKFAQYRDGNVTQNGNQFTVVSYVDAENSFGAMIRTTYICVVEYTGNGKWRLKSLETSP